MLLLLLLLLLCGQTDRETDKHTGPNLYAPDLLMQEYYNNTIKLQYLNLIAF